MTKKTRSYARCGARRWFEGQLKSMKLRTLFRRGTIWWFRGPMRIVCIRFGRYTARNLNHKQFLFVGMDGSGRSHFVPLEMPR